MPCSPSLEYARTNRSSPGWCPRVRSTQRSAVSSDNLEADAVALGVEPNVDDLRQVDRDRGVLGLDLVPALGAPEAVLGRLVLVLLNAEAQDRAALKPHIDPPVLDLGSHQWAGSTSSVSTPPVDLGCRNATRELRMPRRGSLSISWRPASRTASSALSMSSQAYAT